MASPIHRARANRAVLVAVAAVLSVPVAAQAQQTVSRAQKQAYIDSAKAHNQRDAAEDAAFYAHQKRLSSDIAAARKSGNQAELRKLEAMRNADSQHLTRERTEDANNQAHIKRVYGLKTQ